MTAQTATPQKITASSYTPEIAAQIRAAYEAVGTSEEDQEARDLVIATFSASLGKPVKSVIQHCSRAGYYIKKAPAATGKSGGITKATLLSGIATAVSALSEADIESLGKANRHALQVLLNRVAAS